MGIAPEVGARGFTLLELHRHSLRARRSPSVWSCPSSGAPARRCGPAPRWRGFSAMLRHAREQAITTQPRARRHRRPGGTPRDDRHGRRRGHARRASCPSDLGMRPGHPPALTVRFEPEGISTAATFSVDLGKTRLSRHRRRVHRPRAESSATDEPPARQAGFTLLEVLVALAILGIAVVAAIQGFAQGLRLLKLAGDHQQAMLLADQKCGSLVDVKEVHAYEGTEGLLRWERIARPLETPEISPGSGPVARDASIEIGGPRDVGPAAAGRGRTVRMVTPAATEVTTTVPPGTPGGSGRGQTPTPFMSPTSPGTTRWGASEDAHAVSTPTRRHQECRLHAARGADRARDRGGAARHRLRWTARGARAWSRGEDRAELQQHARGVTQVVGRAVGAAYPYRASLSEGTEKKLLSSVARRIGWRW